MNCREAQSLAWKGAIPLQIHLHESEVTTLPVPPPAFVLGPRNGYLPLLLPLVKPYFSNALPPGDDSIWFDYKGLPLKWYIPLGVLFDLLCAVPERPWNLTVHFRGYPQELFSPCEGDENVKHSFMNSLKEAAYIINGNSKVVMNMSQFDQEELWRCVLKGEMEGYYQISSKLKLAPVGEWCRVESVTNSEELRPLSAESTGRNRAGRIPVRLYLRKVNMPIDDLEDFPAIRSWDEITCINKPIEFQKYEGGYFSLCDMIKSLLPGLPFHKSQIDDLDRPIEHENEFRESNVNPNLELGSAPHFKGEEMEEAPPKISIAEQTTKKAKIELVLNDSGQVNDLSMVQVAGADVHRNILSFFLCTSLLRLHTPHRDRYVLLWRTLRFHLKLDHT